VSNLILALGLAALLWPTVRSGQTQSDAITTIAGADACAVRGDSPDRDSDQQWQSPRHATAVVTESVWTSAPVHAGLGGTRVARLFELARFVSSPDPPPASTPPYLLHTPLLI